MQSIGEIAEAIASLTSAERQALMKRLAQADDASANDGRMQAMAEAMNDELFPTDLREVMEDFSFCPA